MSDDQTMILCTTCRKITPHSVGMVMDGDPLRLVLTCEVCGRRHESAAPKPKRDSRVEK